MNALFMGDMTPNKVVSAHITRNSVPLSFVAGYISKSTLAPGHPLGYNGKWHLADCQHAPSLRKMN